MICVTYLDYVSPLLVCGYCSLTSKTGGFWNLLESSQSRIPLIELSHKWTQIIFIILNSKLGIEIWIQPKKDVNSESNFYDVITLDHTRLCSEINLLWSPENLQTTYFEHIIYLVPPGHVLFKKVSGEFILLCIRFHQDIIFTTTLSNA